MTYTDADLASASKKLASLELSEGELEAIAAVFAADEVVVEPGDDDEVAGFTFDPLGGQGNPARGFMADMSGRINRRRGPLAGPANIIIISEGHCY